MKGVFNTMVNEHLSEALAVGTTEVSATLKIGGKTINVLRVVSFTRISKYVEQCFDTYQFAVAIATSDYQRHASQVHGDVEITVMRRLRNKNMPPTKYRGIILESADPTLTAGTNNISVADDLSVSVINIEALQFMAWDLRVSQVGGTFLRTDPLKLTRYLLAKTRLVDGMSNQEFIANIEHVDESQKEYREITLPDGTPFLSMFDYIQNHYGIYSKGLGIYLRDRTWHLFRPYDVDLFNEDRRRLVIYNVPEESMSLPDKTYTIKNQTITIVATGNTTHIDDRDISALNGGTGYRVASVRALELRTTSHSEDGESETTPDDYLSQSDPTGHSSGLVNAPMLSQRLKDDDKGIQSEFVARTGSIIKIQWQNSSPYYLQPGMAVKFIYPVGNKVITRYGTLIGEHYHSYTENNGMIEKTHLSLSELILWVGPK